jgi:hypothetical protein
MDSPARAQDSFPGLLVVGHLKGACRCRRFADEGLKEAVRGWLCARPNCWYCGAPEELIDRKVERIQWQGDQVEKQYVCNVRKLRERSGQRSVGIYSRTP